MADLSKVKIGESTYNLKDAQARTDVATAQGAISAEVTRATGAESGLDTRIKALESKGRYLSTWDATTGKPDTYPELTQLVEGKYNYRSGDYYIVNKVAAENNLMPDGAYITYDGTTTPATWTVPTKAFEGTTLNLGDQFQYDGSKWTYIASATTVAFKNIQGDAEENTNLKGKLDAKLAHKSGKTGTAGDLAYADTASASYTPAGTLAALDVTPAGTIALGDFTQTSTAASLTKADYTPAGSVTGTVVPTGTVNVTVKDASTATAVTDLTYESYTPAGTIAATSSGSFSALKSATFGEDSTNGVQIEGSVSAPAITVTAGSEKTFATGLTGGSVASIDTSKFSGGSFTGASQASFTQGTKASFTQGAKASLSTSNISYVESGVEVAVDETDTEMLVFTNVTAKSAKAVDTFTANGDDSFTANGDDSFTANNVGTFTAAAISDGFFTPNELQSVSTDKVHDTPTAALAEAPAFTGKKYKVATTDEVALKEVAFTGTAADIKLTGAKYLKQEINTATFTGNASGDAITANFAGTEVKNFQVTGVNYDKATANGATFTGTEKSVTPVFSGTAATITVSPN